MIKAAAYAGRKIAVFGLARTGLAAVDALRASGAEVFAWDDAPERQAAVGDAACNLYEADLSQMDGLLLAPGVPLTHPEPHAIVRRASEAGITVFGDTDVFQAARADLPAHQLVGITGTNGKSTTSALIDHMVRTCGRPSALGGNIGTGILSLDPLQADGVYVFELSSYQLDLSHQLKPDVGVLLNIAPDHLDRHGGMDGYVAAKARMFDLVGETGAAVISVDDKHSAAIAADLNCRNVCFSVERRLDDGVSLDGDTLVFCMGGQVMGEMPLAACKTLRGTHNAQNAAAAWIVGHLLGFANGDMRTAFESFPGLAHRQELVGSRNGVTFVNDSKATNADAASRALASFTNIHWIAGGRGKQEPLDGLENWLPNVKKAWLIGEDADRIADFLEGRVKCEKSGTLELALAGACTEAVSGDTVLLSPACASFDQFESFEARGDAFRQAASRWIEKGARS